MENEDKNTKFIVVQQFAYIRLGNFIDIKNKYKYISREKVELFLERESPSENMRGKKRSPFYIECSPLFIGN